MSRSVKMGGAEKSQKYQKYNDYHSHDFERGGDGKYQKSQKLTIFYSNCTIIAPFKVSISIKIIRDSSLDSKSSHNIRGLTIRCCHLLWVMIICKDLSSLMKLIISYAWARQYQKYRKDGEYGLH